MTLTLRTSCCTIAVERIWNASILYDIHVEESFGAVSAALRINEFQVPILLDTAVDETENDIVSETENINQGFDFLIGIG